MKETNDPLLPLAERETRKKGKIPSRMQRILEKGFVQGRDITLRAVILKMCLRNIEKLERLDADPLNAITDNISGFCH